ncbi:MAG TPA: antibiotic biosynthesis monooxygenase family protein [Thermoanaerobaculia bacterium]|nr:antibiotic biosynthesis monooxygenase family protein [Thermoanaerobaculia bacterium]
MTPTYVSISRFRVRNGMEAEVAAAFRERPHLVDTVPGFVKMEVLSPAEDAAEFWLITYWTDEGSFREWHHGHQFRDSHAGIPKGLKLDPAATELRAFHHVAS